MMAEFRFQFMERGVTLLLLILLPLAFFTTEASFLPRDASVTILLSLFKTMVIQLRVTFLCFSIFDLISAVIRCI